VPETTPQRAQRCSVCGQDEPDATLLEVCFSCNDRFHLNPRNDTDGIDHGDAWIGPSLGVHFYCQTCIDQSDAEERAAMAEPGQPAPLAPPPGMPVLPPRVPAPSPSTSAPPTSGASSDPAAPPPPPPRPERPARQRRYRRIDQS
jgi:hypothetical protein